MTVEHQELHLIDWLKRILLAWGLTPAELSRFAHVEENELTLMISLSKEAIEGLPTIPAALENAAALVGLYRELLTVYPTPEEQSAWLSRPNSVLEGQKPIDVIAMGPDHLSYVAYVVQSGLSQTRS
jgi:hypothetical protein